MAHEALALNGSGGGQQDAHPATRAFEEYFGGFRTESRAISQAVPILEEDRELAASIPAAQRDAFRNLLRASVVRLSAGSWDPASASLERSGSLGLLVLDGLMIRNVEVLGRSGAELLGPGDLLRPWELDCDEYASVRTQSAWTIATPARVALLGRRHAAVIGRSPELTAALVGRALRRSRFLAPLLALARIRQLRVRVHAVLWLLAERWGRVTPQGVLLDVPVTHATLGQLIGASRPSITSAVVDLRELGLVDRAYDRGWLLRGDSPIAAEDPPS
jgi:CRP/FNR family cyclic AMP-dependent transcriptional regulator